jgi:hypothetical protein
MVSDGKTKQEYAQANKNEQSSRLQADLEARIEQLRLAKLLDCAPSSVEDNG